MSYPFRPSIQKFTFDRIIEYMRGVFKELPDARTGTNLVYSMEDGAGGAFSVFFTQNPSFLQFQRDMKRTRGRSNANTLFGMLEIPCDNQIRNLLDPVPPDELFSIFAYVMDGLYELGYLDAYRSINGTLLVPMDGTQYFSSSKIHCSNCTVKHHNNGQDSYSHTVITPVITAPGTNTVFPLEPEFICPQDGHDKQDCENAAAKRWLARFGPRYRDWRITVLGDDLYCKQPVCEAILNSGCRRAQDEKRDVPVNPFALRSATAFCAPVRPAVGAGLDKQTPSPTPPTNGLTACRMSLQIFSAGYVRKTHPFATAKICPDSMPTVDYRPSLRSPWPAAEGLSFVLVCKPDSHSTLYEWVQGLEATGGVQTRTVTRRRGKQVETDTYRFVNRVPLRDGKDALEVNWCELTTRDANGEVIYKNAFATNYEITHENVLEIVQAGRARWKVENENNNVLKTKGYHLTHNFGHGKQHLSAVLATLNLLAFLMHTVLSLMDANYALVRQELVSRKTFFDDLRALTRYLCFDSWDALLRFMMRGLEIEFADTG